MKYVKYLVVLLLAVLAIWVLNSQSFQPQAMAIDKPELALINETRKNLGKDELIAEKALNQSAADKCSHMITNNYWSHDGGGRSWDSFLPAYKHVGEILARGYVTAQDQHKGWLDSRPHYNTLTDDYKYFGVANCNYRDGQQLSVVHFGK
jgi:uncharacterized protein YkwD